MPVERREDDGWQDDAASGGNAGQHAVWPACQLSVEKLAFDFQAHEKEEHRHQGIVDPVRKAERTDIEVQRFEIDVRERRVRHDERERCRHHEADATRRFAIQKAPHD